MDAAWYGYFSRLIYLQRLVDIDAWRSEKSTQNFLVAMTETTPKSSLRKKEFISVRFVKGRVHCDRRGKACQQDQGSGWSHCPSHPGRREREQGVEVSCPSSKATPQWLPSPSKAPPSAGSITSPKSTTSWDQVPQTINLREAFLIQTTTASYRFCLFLSTGGLWTDLSELLQGAELK